VDGGKQYQIFPGNDKSLLRTETAIIGGESGLHVIGVKKKLITFCPIFHFFLCFRS